MSFLSRFSFLSICLVFWAGCSQSVAYDLIIRNALIYDGSGGAPYMGALAVNADTIAKIGDLDKTIGREEIDAQGQVLSPGFINMLSWATVSLIADGRGQSDLRQGVTLEVMGEGS